MKENLSQLINQIVDIFEHSNEQDTFFASAQGLEYPSISYREIASYFSRIENLVNHSSVPDFTPFLSNMEVRMSSYLKFFNDYGVRPGMVTPNIVLSIFTTLSWYEAELSKLITPLSVRSISDTQLDLESKINNLSNWLNNIDGRKSEVVQQITVLEEGIKIATSLEQRNIQFEAFDLNLKQTKDLVDRFVSENEKLSIEISSKKEEFLQIKEQADALILRCEAAYSAATTTGLARSFAEKAEKLGHTVLIWCSILVSALAFGGYFANQRLEKLLEVINTTLIKQKTTHMEGFFVGIELLLLSFTFGGTIWIAWLATKQISINFKLKEDYGFKATFAMAYEGYRKEAVRIDPELEKRLFTCAIERLEESPIRLINNEKENHTPIQEVLNTKFSEKSIDFLTSLKTDIMDVVKSSVSKKD